MNIYITQNAQKIINNSSAETKQAVHRLLAFFAQKMNKHEELEVLEWYAPFLYFEVRDTRWSHYPCNCRALVSFDTTNNRIASFTSENRYQFSRKGWGNAITGLLGYKAIRYSDCGYKAQGRHC